MKTVVAVFVLLCAFASSNQADVVRIELDDGELIEGKLHLPENVDTIGQVVIFVHGTGPGTYLNRRKFGPMEFNYYDMFGEQLNSRGLAMFSYNKRGVVLGDVPPMYEEIDREKFRRVVPSTDVKDLETVVRFLRADARLAEAKVVLLGWSEGTIISAMVAENKENRISALLLAGYANESMFDIIKWQFSGESSMINLRPVFDSNNDGSIDQEEYESDGKRAVQMRAAMQDSPFAKVDKDEDGLITSNDFRMLVEKHYQSLLERIESGDEDWIWENYFHVSIEWLVEHFDLEPNRTRLLRLDLPIYIFHGDADANVPIQGVRDLQAGFAKAGKTNLQAFFFEAHDHDLNFLEWVRNKQAPAGIAKIFEVAAALNGASSLPVPGK